VAPATSAFFRALYALPVLYLLWRLHRGRDRRRPAERRLAFLAGVFLGLDLAVWHRSIELIGAGLATVLGNTQVLFVGLASWLLLRERPPRAALVSAPVVFAGVVLIAGLKDPRAYGEDPTGGVLFGLLTGISYTAFLLVLRRANPRRAAAVGPLYDATAGAALALFVLALPDPSFDPWPSWPAHGWLLALALGSQVGGWLLITHALPRLPALEISVLLLLQPMATVLWGFLLFAEHLSPLQWSGVALVLAGVGWTSLAGARRRPAG